MRLHPLLGLSLALAAPAWGKETSADLQKKISDLTHQIDEMKPGLGEIMGVIQQHHLKLYFAGSSQNWALADYEADEIKEGLEDAAKYYNHFKEVKTPLKDLFLSVTPALDTIGSSVKKKSKADFLAAFDALTAACNGCHRAAEHPFIVIQTPHQPDFSNQRFEP